MKWRKLKPLDKARVLLKDKQNIVVFTGSGASAPSGIPTFTGPDAMVDWGIFKYLADKEWRKEIWYMMFDKYANVQPNPTHTAIDGLVGRGRGTHITSNVDGLCEGIEVCGSARRIVCHDCGVEFDVRDVRDRWLEGETDPPCLLCGGTLRPDVVLIGEMFDENVMADYGEVLGDMDALVVIGASTLIGMWQPAVEHAKENRIPIISINMERKPWNRISHAHIEGDSAEMTPLLLS